MKREWDFSSGCGGSSRRMWWGKTALRLLTASEWAGQQDSSTPACWLTEYHSACKWNVTPGLTKVVFSYLLFYLPFLVLMSFCSYFPLMSIASSIYSHLSFFSSFTCGCCSVLLNHCFLVLFFCLLACLCFFLSFLYETVLIALVLSLHLPFLTDF